jgi:hypothetical protein
MSNRTIIIIALVALLTSFAVGRFTAPEHIKIQEKIVTVEKVVVQVQHEVKTVVTKPDGSSTSTTVTDTNTHSNTDSNSSTISKDIPVNKNIVSISALVGTHVLPFGDQVYGASISKNFIGPVRLGVWGLSDKTFGFSLGLDL